jgi:integrase/recombinase XerC
MPDDRDLGRAIDEFLFQLLANGRMPSSVTSYARELDLLRRYLAGRPVKGITTSDVSRFLVSPPVRARRDGREKAVATLNRTKAVIRTFFGWCESTKRTDGNPAFLVKGCPCTPPIRYMTRPEVRRFLNEMRRSKHQLARRDYALFSTIVYTGLRLSEATRALWGDVDLRRRRLLVRLAKGGGQEMRNIPGRLLHPLVVLRRDVKDVIDLDKWPLFRSRGGDALSSRAVQYRFAFWLARSGMRQRMSVHSLRHTFATLLYRATGDLLLVNRALGHRDIRSTQRYAHVEDRRLVQALNRL